MTITVETVGRDLHISLDGIEEPFIARPLPSRAGIQITDTYLNSSVGIADVEELTKALIMAVDGGRVDEATGRWEPVAIDEQVTFTRIGDELRQAEAEAVLMPAFFWQTVLGMDGVRAYIEGGEGLSGTLKAVAALSARLGRISGGGVDNV